MSLYLTIALLIVSTLATVLCGWRGARPTDIHKGPRMVPWRFLMLIFAALVMMLLIHLVALMGGGPAARPYI